MYMIAYILINTETGSTSEVLESVKKIKNVIEAHSVYGVYDVVAKVEVESLKKLSETVTLKIRFEGFQTFTRSKTLPCHIQDEKYVLFIILQLFREFSNNEKKVRLVGIKLSNLEKNQKVRQTSLINYALI